MIQRDYYPISEAAEKLNCTVENLIHLGAVDKLDIYVLATGWFAKHVFIWEDTTGSGLNSFKQLDPNSAGGGVYKLPLSGPCLIKQSCLQNNECNSGNREIVLDGNQALSVPASQFKFIVYPNYPGNLMDAPLVIMTRDIMNLLSDDTDNQRPEYRNHENWPPELEIALDAWLAVADVKDPGKTPKDLLIAWLQKHNHKLNISDAAIERIAKVANWDKDPGPKKKIRQPNLS
jgi:hypothetical protein